MRLSLWNKINKNFNFFLLNLSREWVSVGWMGRGHMSFWIIFLKYPLGIKPINPNGKREKKIHRWNVFCLSKTWKKGNKKNTFFICFFFHFYRVHMKASGWKQITYARFKGSIKEVITVEEAQSNDGSNMASVSSTKSIHLRLGAKYHCCKHEWRLRCG